MITYKFKHGVTEVYLEGKRVGTIKPVSTVGFAYYPTGQIIGGTIYPSIKDVKQSIEGIRIEARVLTSPVPVLDRDALDSIAPVLYTSNRS